MADKRITTVLIETLPFDTPRPAVRQTQRFLTLDVLRGIALLVILMLNIFLPHWCGAEF
jgi:uncharacterized membrane protein YeiB